MESLVRFTSSKLFARWGSNVEELVEELVIILFIGSVTVQCGTSIMASSRECDGCSSGGNARYCNYGESRFNHGNSRSGSCHSNRDDSMEKSIAYDVLSIFLLFG